MGDVAALFPEHADRKMRAMRDAAAEHVGRAGEIATNVYDQGQRIARQVGEYVQEQWVTRLVSAAFGAPFRLKTCSVTTRPPIKNAHADAGARHARGGGLRPLQPAGRPALRLARPAHSLRLKGRLPCRPSSPSATQPLLKTNCRTVVVRRCAPACNSAAATPWARSGWCWS